MRFIFNHNNIATRFLLLFILVGLFSQSIAVVRADEYEVWRSTQTVPKTAINAAQTAFCAQAENAAICAVVQPPLVTSDICTRVPYANLIHVNTNEVGKKCVANSWVEKNGYRHHPWSGIEDAACFDAKWSQKLCQLNKEARITGSAEAVSSSCIPGMEINCLPFQSVEISSALALGETLFSAPQTACSALTIGNVGYSQFAFHQYDLNRQCMQSDANPLDTVSCEIFGRTMNLNSDFCNVINQCVTPRIEARYPIIGTEGSAQIYQFPSGDRALHVDLTCSFVASDNSLHRMEYGCRAIDINAHQNYGNLQRDAYRDPVSDMPPELVAIMEDCGIIWGGRYSGADGVLRGCDPMEFAWAPTCEVLGYSIAVTQWPSQEVDMVMNSERLELQFINTYTVSAQSFADLIAADHPYYSDPNSDWWLLIRTLNGKQQWSPTIAYRIGSDLVVE